MKKPLVIVIKSLLAFVGFLCVLFALQVWKMVSEREGARPGLCFNNMRIIDHVKDMLAAEHGWTNGHIVAATPEETWAILGPLYYRVTDQTNWFPCCPNLRSGSHYNYNPIGVAPTCPYGHNHVYVRLTKMEAQQRAAPLPRDPQSGHSEGAH